MFKKTLPVLFVLLAGVVGGPVQAQTEAEQSVLPDTLIVKIDSLIEVRLDSAAQNIQAESDTGESQFASEGEEALAQLEELISFYKIIWVIIFLVASYFATIFISRVLDNLSEKISRHRLRIKRAIPIVRVVIWTVAIYIVIAGIINPPSSTLITVLASVGIAVGLASQDMLKNIFGGIMLILDRPFQVGDKVGVGEHYGEITQIGLRSSRMVTPGDSIITIPNGELIRTSVSNANSGELYCMVITEIFLPAECPVDEVKEIAYKAAISSRYIYLQKPVEVLVENEMHHRRFVLKLKVKAYVLDIRFEFPFQSDVTERILTELRHRNIIFNEVNPKKMPEAGSN